MSQPFAPLPYRTDHRKRCLATLSLICDDESLSDAQIKAYQTRLQEYRTFLDAVSRLALCSNVCVTEEAVTIGEHGLLTGESLNALQHAGAISVYNTLQQNNWEFPISEEGEVAIVKAHVPIPDEFLDSEKPIRSDWPAVHISECFVEGERAKLHGSVRPLRTFLPPTIVFRNAADVDEDAPEPEVNIINSGPEGSIEIVQSLKGLSVKKPCKDGKGVKYIPIDEYYFGRQDGNADYVEEKGDFRFKCAVCQRIFYSNTKLMSHILGHVDEASQACLDTADTTQCSVCNQMFSCAFDLRDHIEKEHTVPPSDSNLVDDEAKTNPLVQITSQLLTQQRIGDGHDDPVSNFDHMEILAPNFNGITNTPSCRICGKVSASKLLLAHHLQSTHRQREMPYVCRLCLFRSSMYEDILDHFKKMHDSSNHLLCTYCLRIFTPSDARSNAQPVCLSASGGISTVGLGLGVGQTQVYLQHLRLHQIKHQLRRCPTCRLNFTNKSDYQVHRRLDHKATRDLGTEKPDLRQDSYELECYQTKQHTTQATENFGDHNTSIDSIRIVRPHVTSMNAPEAGCAKNLAINFLPENIESLECLECGKRMGDSEHAQYLPCSVCRFATCCSVGFQRHFQKLHVYSNASQSTDLDCGMPMVRQIFFDWCNEYNLPCNDNASSGLATVSGDRQDLVINEITDLTPSDMGNFTTIVFTDELGNVVNVPETEKQSLTKQPNPNDSIRRYMESQVDSRLLYCSHCGTSNLDGNSLARHLVEECGTLTATLRPDMSISFAQTEARQSEASEKHQESDRNESDNPYGTTDQKIIMISEPSLLSTSTTNISDNDVVMMTVDTDQAQSMRLVESQEDQTAMLSGTQITTQSDGTTTIDVTDEGGEVVQQFILPDDLQLEEGQTLVMIQGENGQPQLAIVNQADLINDNNSEILVQTENGEANDILIYTNGLETQVESSELNRGEEEKENQQFIV
ncbi:unnamed protein product [Schistosoma guineensis]|nr:unnamed protein product [Schistosoma guineensis]